MRAHRKLCSTNSAISASSLHTGSEQDKAELLSERAALLERHGITLPDQPSLDTEGLFAFLQGAVMSRHHSCGLSRWLATLGPQNVGLLLAMQALERSFVPTLNLVAAGPADATQDQHDEHAIALLQQAQHGGLVFCVQLNANVTAPVATSLCAVMGAPGSRVTGLLYPSAGLPVCQAARRALREGLAQCLSLQQVGGQPGLLPLLSRGVDSLVLAVLAPSAGVEELARVLSLGGTQHLTLKTDSAEWHKAIADLVGQINRGPSPAQRVHTLELCCYTARSLSLFFMDEQGCTTLVKTLLSIPNLIGLTLPHPYWLLLVDRQMLLAMLKRQGLHFLRFAQPLTAIEIKTPAEYELADTLAQAEALLARNRQCAQLLINAVVPAFIQSCTLQAFAHSSVPHLTKSRTLPIDPLEQWLKQAFGATPTASVLAQVNRATASRALEIRKDFEPPVVPLLIADAPLRRTRKRWRLPKAAPDNCSVQ